MSLGAKALIKCRGEPLGSPTEALASVRRSLYQCGAPSRIVQAIQLVKTIADSFCYSECSGGVHLRLGRGQAPTLQVASVSPLTLTLSREGREDHYESTALLQCLLSCKEKRLHYMRGLR